MASNATKLWHNFLIYLPVFLILSMISIIYFSYLFTYIAVLINAENQLPANFLLINTSNYNNAKTKGIILLIITMIFVIILLFSIIKTVITNPGFFKDPSNLECKIAAINPEKNPTLNKMCKKHSHNNKSKSGELPENEKANSYEYLEKEILNANNNINKNSSSNSELLLEQEKSKLENENNSSEKIQKSQQTIFLNNSKAENNNNNINSSEYENSKLIINNFTNIIKENPLNNLEYLNSKREIGIYYNNRKSEISYEENFQRKNNEEIIENNKKIIMDFKENCKNPKNKNKFFFDLSNLYRKTDITKMNQCGTCQRIKIERSHHCKMCQRCVLKMDHHCPWLANCIGFFNYKFFCLTHFYGTISTGIIFLTYWETVVNVNLNFNSTLLECWYVTFVYMMNLSLMLFLMWLLWVNVKLVFNGETIIEQSDRERFPSTKSFNVYDMGWKRNFTNVFGDRWYKWLIPVFANKKGDGMFYETKKNFYFEKEDLKLKELYE